MGSKRLKVAPASCPTSGWPPPQPRRPVCGLKGSLEQGRQAYLSQHIYLSLSRNQSLELVSQKKGRCPP